MTHVSHFALDRLIAGEMDGTPREREIRSHLEACAVCAGQHRAFERAAQLFVSELSAHPAPQQVTPTQQARPRARGLLFAAVAGVALLGSIPFLRKAAPGDGLRPKGSLGLEVWVARKNGPIESLAPGARVSPDDRLRFALSSASPGYIAVASVDGGDHVSLYYPPPRAPLQAVPPGRHLLEGAVALDDVLGTERLIALRCGRLVDRDDLVAALTASVQTAKQGRASLEKQDLVRGCAASTFSLNKVQAP